MAVDVETGEVRVLKSVAGDDVGQCINPAAVEGQIHGGVSAGQGYAPSEAMEYDEGRLTTSSLSEYLIPTSMDIPEVQVKRITAVAEGRADNTRGLRDAYSARTPDEVAACYDSWAPDYETHMSNVGYAHPAVVAAMLARHLPPGDGAILDAGAGTGLLGELLVTLGYSNLTGIDASREMLARAAAKQIYRELHPMIIGGELDFSDDRFAATVGAGVFTEGHAPLSGLDDLIRVTRPGGYLVFSIARNYLEETFDPKQRGLETAGRWRLLDTSKCYNSTPLEGDISARVFVFQVL
ncbi:MAG TPA: SAM-dependent methyltransferase [Gammaproteobacteria bacterium]|nr:SAM-dependent methyltransferase [Acidiferrobacteraceae bacterium]HCX88490.1 SAM-dependent methyltransferase [Gammaproteobacteria bacterium]